MITNAKYNYCHYNLYYPRTLTLILSLSPPSTQKPLPNFKTDHVKDNPITKPEPKPKPNLNSISNQN